MVEMILAGVIIGFVLAAATATGVRDWRRRRRERREDAAARSAADPIPGGWTAANRTRAAEGEEASRWRPRSNLTARSPAPEEVS